jgi:hypothetical protein
MIGSSSNVLRGISAGDDGMCIRNWSVEVVFIGVTWLRLPYFRVFWLAGNWLACSYDAQVNGEYSYSYFVLHITTMMPLCCTMLI